MKNSKHGSNRGCLFSALGIIILILALIVIVGSCSDKSVNEDLKEIETQVEDDTVNENIDTASTTEIGLEEYKLAVENFYQEISSYLDNPENLSANAVSDKISNTMDSITTFLSHPLKDEVERSDRKVINELRSLLDNELHTCRLLNNYYQTKDESYLAAAKANIESIKTELDKINQETEE